MNRRGILAGGVAAGVVGATGLCAEISDAPKTAASNLKVSITRDGVTYSYPNGPALASYFVIFGTDGRIVFHLGALGDLNKPVDFGRAYHLGPHHVKIENGATVLFDADIPHHFWNAEWTYRPAPIAVTKTPAQIVSANRMFPFGDTGERIAPPHNYVFAGPMDSAGITKYMPTTGERGDIGLVTDPSAHYLLGGNPGPMLAWAQAGGSCPLHFRDEKTGKPIDLTKYPQTNAYDAPGYQGAPWLPKGPKDPDGYTRYADNWSPQQAHFCEMSYVAYMATGDLGLLGDLQYEANFCVLTDAALSKPSGAIISGEARGLAWGFRQLFMAHIATKDLEAQGPLPATLHPSSYFKTLLDNALKFYTVSMHDPANQTFRLIGGTGGSTFGPWQVDYQLTALAFAILTGHSDWTPFYLWALGNVIARTNGASGYPPGYGTAYYMKANPGGWAAAFAALIGDPEGNLKQDQYDSLKSDPYNGGTAMTGHEYIMTTRAALIMAARLEKLGLANVRAVYPELDKCIATVDRMVRAGGGMNARTSVVVG